MKILNDSNLDSCIKSLLLDAWMLRIFLPLIHVANHLHMNLWVALRSKTTCFAITLYVYFSFAAITGRLNVYFWGDRRSLHYIAAQPNVTNPEHKSPENPTATTFGLVGGLIIYIYISVAILA